MAIFFLILIILSSVIIAFFILIQNPKGGGLSGSIAGFSTQFMGVKQTTDVLEKGTWVMAVIIALLSIFSPVFISQGTGSGTSEPNLRPNTNKSVPANPAPALPQPQQTTPPAQR
jgi:preprotein translocase subunit SecG